MKNQFKILVIIFFIQGIVTNIHHPLMPDYVNSINLPDYMFGFFFAFMNLGIMLGGPFWGMKGDRGNKKNLVFLGLFIYGICQILFGMHFIFSMWPLSFIRIISGFGIAASFTIISGEIIIISSREYRARNIAIGVAALGIGGAIGQFLGGFINTNNIFISIFRTNEFFYAFLFQGVLVIMLSFLVFVIFKPQIIETDSNKKRAQFWEGFKNIKNINKELLFFLISLSLVSIAATNIDKYFDVYYRNFLGYGADDLGNFKMLIGFVTVAANLFLVPIFMKVKNRLILISIFKIISSIIIFIVFRADGRLFIIYLYTLYMIYIILKAVYSPLEQEHISTFSTNENISTTMGIRQSFLSIGTIIGPIFGAFIYEYNPRLLFDVSVIIFMISILLLFISSLFRIKTTNQLN